MISVAAFQTLTNPSNTTSPSDGLDPSTIINPGLIDAIYHGSPLIWRAFRRRAALDQSKLAASPVLGKRRIGCTYLPKLLAGPQEQLHFPFRHRFFDGARQYVRCFFRRRNAASSAVVPTFHMLSATLIVTPRWDDLVDAAEYII